MTKLTNMPSEATPLAPRGSLRRLLGTSAVALTIAFLCGVPAWAVTVSNGSGHGSIVAEVDSAVDAVMSDPATRIAGMTVAVSRNGKLLLNKGYGHADRSNWTRMQPYHRSNIGSVSKVVVTGPAAWQLMKAKGIDPATKKVYGPTGVLGTTYVGQQDASNQRFNPIVSMAIAPDDKVYTWYGDGTYSVGNSTSLGQTRLPYIIPHNRKPSSIRGMDIAKNGQVYTWYDDRSLSRGTPGDLGAIEKPPLDAEDKPTKLVSLAPGRSILNVIDMAIAKSDDHVYVWYDDGTVSSGTSTDLDLYRSPYVYYPIGLVGSTRYNLRAFGIAKNDQVYSWYINGVVARGDTSNTHYLNGGQYTTPSIPQAPNFVEWYGQTTIQNLIDHKAGFAHDGDLDGAARLWAVPVADLSYDQLHKYMLLTRKLEFQPGTSSSYSNHGYGLWTLLVPKLAGGTSYFSYATNNYLAPLGLSTKVKPMAATYDVNMSHGYGYANGAFVARTAKDAGLGLAAGGWTASAEAMLRISNHLMTTYGAAEVDSLGWKKDSHGKLAHDGSVGGGAAYICIFPQGYMLDGADVSKIHVALASNTEVSTTVLKELADEIAIAVSAGSVPTHYDLWAAYAGG